MGHIKGEIYMNGLLCNTSIVFCLLRIYIQEKALTLGGAIEVQILDIETLEIEGWSLVKIEKKIDLEEKIPYERGTICGYPPHHCLEKSYKDPS